MSFTPRSLAGLGRSALASTGVAALIVLQGCATTGAGQQSPVSRQAMTSSAAGRDIVTASDETEVRRRARLRLELAGAYFSRGQLTTALDEVKQAIALDGNMSAAYELRGLIYSGMNEPGLAEESYKRAIQLDARNGSVLHNYAWFLCQRQQYAEADALFARAVELPMSVQTSRTLMARGVCQMQAGQLPEAQASLKRSYEMEPGNPVTAFNLASLFYRNGDLDRARFYIRRVNNVPELANAESLWLGIRIERKLGGRATMEELATQLRSRFPNARETTALDLGRFDD
ncbi:MAG: type IV pilus biogenesis/stability protein PilW [Aquabacterium sp.]|jgi:type IV pilus assembly protein PilF|uniref:type IV pilus biogenesis/stability protein PilW n=1 Tax=Aquabacterium sp. TaxID=1872578 RepID=UPI003BB00AAC